MSEMALPALEGVLMCDSTSRNGEYRCELPADPPHTHHHETVVRTGGLWPTVWLMQWDA